MRHIKMITLWLCAILASAVVLATANIYYPLTRESETKATKAMQVRQLLQGELDIDQKLTMTVSRNTLVAITLSFGLLLGASHAKAETACRSGYTGVGGPAYMGVGGPCYTGVGGGGYNGVGGPAYAGVGGPCYNGVGGPAYDGVGGPA